MFRTPSSTPTKRCSTCRNIFPATNTFFHHNVEDKSGFKSQCRYCRNREKRVVYAAKKEKILERNRVYYKANSKKIIAKKAEWRRKNKERVAAIVARKRMKRRQVAKNDLTAEQWQRIQEYFKYRCAYCGKKTKLTKDHITPIHKGGNHTYSNIVPACQSCNSRKGIRNVPRPIQPLLLL